MLVGAKWILESALALLPAIDRHTDVTGRYRKAEGLNNDAQMESQVKASHEKFGAMIEEEYDDGYSD